MSSFPLERGAAMALGIAATAMPFAGSPQEEAERWLRILRTHGDSSLILSSVGVTEGSQEDSAADSQAAAPSGEVSPHDAVARVAEEAARRAAQRGGEQATTEDLLRAVIDVYGEVFDRVLRAHGTSRAEVLALLDRPGSDS